MFGIGFGELVIILVVVLIAVGPEKMPTFMKAVGKGLREFRRATRELRNSVGIDELLRDEDLKELRRPIDLDRPARRRAEPRAPAYELTDEDAENEFPADGTDIVHLRADGRAREAGESGGGSDGEPAPEEAAEAEEPARPLAREEGEG